MRVPTRHRLAIAAMALSFTAALAADAPAPSPAPAPAPGGPPGGAPARGAMRGPGPMSPEEQIDARVAMLAHRLQLTPDQTTQLRTILQSGTEQFKALREKHLEMEKRGLPSDGSAQEKMKAEVQDLRDKQDAKIAAILTPEQKVEFNKLREELRQRMQQLQEQRKQAPPPPPPPSR